MPMTIPERHLADARSKKKICLYDTDDLEYVREQTKNHDIQDRFDGLCVFELKLMESLRKYGKSSDEHFKMRRMYEFNLSFLSGDMLLQEMASLGLVTSIDRSVHGKSLIKHFLHE